MGKPTGCVEYTLIDYMNQRNIRLLATAMLASLLVSGACKRNEDVVAPKEVWRQHPDYTFYSSPIISSVAFDDLFFSCGLYFVSIMKKGRHGGDEVQHYMYGSEVNAPVIFSPLMMASPRSRLGGVAQQGELIDFMPFTMLGSSTLRLDLSKAVPGVRAIGWSGPEWGAFAEPHSGRVKFLTSYHGEGGVGLLLLELEYAGASSLVKLIGGKRIPLASMGQYIRKIRYINGSFYVMRDNTDSDRNMIARISADGEVLDIGPQLNSSTLSEGFVAYGKEAVVFFGDENRVAISTDKGITWKQSGVLPLRVSNIHAVRDRIIGQPSLSQLVDVDARTMKLTEISKEGLPEITIQAINHFRDTVYVSTLGGGMYKRSHQGILDEITNANNRK